MPVADKIDLSNDNLTSATSGASLLHALGNDDLADATGTSDAIQVEFDQIKNKYVDIFPAVAASAPPRAPPRFVTLNQAVSIQVQYGTVVLPAGTRLELVSQDASEVHVRYNNSEQAIPIGAVDSR